MIFIPTLFIQQFIVNNFLILLDKNELRQCSHGILPCAMQHSRLGEQSVMGISMMNCSWLIELQATWDIVFFFFSAGS
jgi:hypothetical protein